MGWKRIVAGVVLIATMLTGCSLFPAPPSDLVAATERYEALVRALPGVAKAEATVRSVDPKDRPNDWEVWLIVDATSADGLDTVPALVADVTPPAADVIRVTLRFPAAQGLASVNLTNASAADVERAGILRHLPFTASVGLSGEFSVELVAGTRLADAVSQIRASGVLSYDPFGFVTLNQDDGAVVDVSLAGPSDALITLIESLDGDSGVDYIRSTEPSLESPRPRLSLDADDPARWVQALTELGEPRIEGRPSTAFSVHNDGETVSGFVGLPLGSAEPEDLPVAEEAQPTDPIVLAGLLAEDSTSVSALLATAAETSGIPGAAEVIQASCSLDGGAQVWGSLLLPVFDYADSADVAYNAIVAAWEADGYAHTDQAMGESIYTPSETRPVMQLTIRGTAEGIRVSAWGACRV